MTFKRQLTTFVAVLALLGGAAPAVVPVAEAAAAAQGKIGPKVGKPLQEAQQLANKGDFQGAMAKVNEAQAVEPKTPAEQSVIYEFQGFVALKLSDFETAAKAYAGAVDNDMVAPEKLPDHLSTLTKLEYQNKNYPAAIKYGNMSLQNGGNTDIALLVAQAYYLQKDFAGAANAFKNLIALAEKNQVPVQEEWLKLLMSSQYNNKDTAGVMATMEQFLQKFPSDKYWYDALTLVEDNSNLKSDEDRLQVLRLKNKMTRMQAAEYVNMAQLALRQGVPGDAKVALEKGFSEGVLSKKDDSALLEEARTSAQKDKSSLPTQAKEIASVNKGSAWLSLGEAYISYGQCQNAVDFIKQAQQKNIVDADRSNLDLGMAYACNNQNTEAAAAFGKIPADSKYGPLARLWIIALPQLGKGSAGAAK